MGVLSCVSIIAQSWILDKVYLLATQGTVELPRFEQATFSKPLLLRTPTFSKHLYCFVRGTFSEDVFF